MSNKNNTSLTDFFNSDQNNNNDMNNNNKEFNLDKFSNFNINDFSNNNSNKMNNNNNDHFNNNFNDNNGNDFNNMNNNNNNDSFNNNNNFNMNNNFNNNFNNNNDNNFNNMNNNNDNFNNNNNNNEFNMNNNNFNGNNNDFNMNNNFNDNNFNNNSNNMNNNNRNMNMNNPPKRKSLLPIIIGVGVVAIIILLLVTRCALNAVSGVGSGKNGYTSEGKTIKVREVGGSFDLTVNSIDKYTDKEDLLYKGEFIKVDVTIDNKGDSFAGAIMTFSLADSNKEQIGNGIEFSNFPKKIQTLELDKNKSAQASIYFSDEENVATKEYMVNPSTFEKVKYLKISVISYIDKEKYKKEGTISASYENYFVSVK